MSAVIVSLIVFACVFGGMLVGMLVRAKLPERYISKDTKDVINLALGVIATMNALVLGLLISTAKGSYDLKRGQLTQIAADVILMDRTLALYGPETKDVRRKLRALVENFADQLESFQGYRPRRVSPDIQSIAQDFYQSVRALAPRDPGQRALKDEAVHVSFQVAEIRALTLARQTSSIPAPFLAILVFWLMVLFSGFGFFAPPQFVTLIALPICAFSISAAIFLILQMDQPLTGLMRISLEPLRNALSVLGG